MKLLVMRVTGLILALSSVACERATGSVVGGWERTHGQRAWLQFERDGSFNARVGSDTSLIRGTYRQERVTVTVTGNYTRTLTLRDGILLAEDGTEYRRVSTAP
jgi:hypothetical protein